MILRLSVKGEAGITTKSFPFSTFLEGVLQLRANICNEMDIKGQKSAHTGNDVVTKEVF